MASVTGFAAPVAPRTTVPHCNDAGDTVTVGPVLEGVTVRLNVVVAVRLPETPLMVTVDVPVAAVALAVSVNVLVVVAGFGANPAVTPLGKPEALKVTLPVNPPAGTTVIVLLPLAPWTILRLVGFAIRAKLGAATVRVTEVVCVMAPETPVMVMVDVPAAALALTVRVKVLVDVVGLVLNPAVTPVGNPEALKVTLPLKPPEGTTVIVLVSLWPC